MKTTLVHRILQIATLLLTTGVVSGCQETAAPPVVTPAANVKVAEHATLPYFSPVSLASLTAYFQAQHYDWKTLRQGVPPFVLQKFPPDMNAKANLKQKKKAFFLGLLPLVLLTNEEIMTDRQELLQLLEKNQKTRDLSLRERRRVRQITEDYGLRGNALIDHRVRQRLLKRVDIIPPSLALAQAANESAWGSSRFARKGNNLFGQWTFTPGTGIVPEDRPDGATYEVRRFKTLFDSVRAYIHNLNTHTAYVQLREIRYQLRQDGEELSGVALAAGLLRYSTRREAYVTEIREMIAHNQLSQLNSLTLRPISRGTVTIGPGGQGLLSSRYHLAERD